MFSGKWLVFAPLIAVALALKLLGYSYEDTVPTLYGAIAVIVLGIAGAHYGSKRKP
jgi:hypothetical protein